MSQRPYSPAPARGAARSSTPTLQRRTSQPALLRALDGTPVPTSSSNNNSSSAHRVASPTVRSLPFPDGMPATLSPEGSFEVLSPPKHARPTSSRTGFPSPTKASAKRRPLRYLLILIGIGIVTYALHGFRPQVQHRGAPPTPAALVEPDATRARAASVASQATAPPRPTPTTAGMAEAKRDANDDGSAHLRTFAPEQQNLDSDISQMEHVRGGPPNLLTRSGFPSHLVVYGGVTTDLLAAWRGVIPGLRLRTVTTGACVDAAAEFDDRFRTVFPSLSALTRVRLCRLVALLEHGGMLVDSTVFPPPSDATPLDAQLPPFAKRALVCGSDAVTSPPRHDPAALNAHLQHNEDSDGPHGKGARRCTIDPRFIVAHPNDVFVRDAVERLVSRVCDLVHARPGESARARFGAAAGADRAADTEGAKLVGHAAILAEIVQTLVGDAAMPAARRSLKDLLNPDSDQWRLVFHRAAQEESTVVLPVGAVHVHGTLWTPPFPPHVSVYKQIDPAHRDAWLRAQSPDLVFYTASDQACLHMLAASLLDHDATHADVARNAAVLTELSDAQMEPLCGLLSLAVHGGFYAAPGAVVTTPLSRIADAVDATRVFVARGGQAADAVPWVVAAQANDRCVVALVAEMLRRFIAGTAQHATPTPLDVFRDSFHELHGGLCRDGSLLVDPTTHAERRVHPLPLDAVPKAALDTVRGAARVVPAQSEARASGTAVPRRAFVAAPSQRLHAEAYAIDATWRVAEPTVARDVLDPGECKQLAAQTTGLEGVFGKLRRDADGSLLCGLLAVHRYGGIYMDLDVAWARPLREWLDFSSDFTLAGPPAEPALWFFAAAAGEPCLRDAVADVAAHAATADTATLAFSAATLVASLRRCTSLPVPALTLYDVTAGVVRHLGAKQRWHNAAPARLPAHGESTGLVAGQQNEAHDAWMTLRHVVQARYGVSMPSPPAADDE